MNVLYDRRKLLTVGIAGGLLLGASAASLADDNASEPFVAHFYGKKVAP